MSNLFNQSREFIDKSFNNEAQMVHFDRTVYWLKILKPDADEVFLIAAISHDIERAFREKKSIGKFENNQIKFTDEDHLRNHQEKGAEIMGDFLKKQGVDQKIIDRVKHLISKHEVGGDENQNILKDADSLSFLENNADIFLNRLDKLGYERVKEKFDWMYNRMTLEKSKEIGLPFYKEIISKLNLKAGKL